MALIAMILGLLGAVCALLVGLTWTRSEKARYKVLARIERQRPKLLLTALVLILLAGIAAKLAEDLATKHAEDRITKESDASYNRIRDLIDAQADSVQYSLSATQDALGKVLASIVDSLALLTNLKHEDSFVTPVLYKLAVLSEPSGADVVVDGIWMGRTHCEVTIPAGVHEVVLHLPGYLDAAVITHIPNQTLVSLDLDLGVQQR